MFYIDKQQSIYVNLSKIIEHQDASIASIVGSRYLLIIIDCTYKVGLIIIFLYLIDA